MLTFNTKRIPKRSDYVLALFGLPMAGYYLRKANLPILVLNLVSFAFVVQLFLFELFSIMALYNVEYHNVAKYTLISMIANHAVSIVISLYCTYLAHQRVDDESTSRKNTGIDWQEYLLAVLNPSAELAILVPLKPVVFLAHFALNGLFLVSSPFAHQTILYLYSTLVLSSDVLNTQFYWKTCILLISYYIASVASLFIVLSSKSKRTIGSDPGTNQNQ